MRTRKTKQGITVKAYAGSTGVLLAFNVTDKRREGLLGFSIERKEAGQDGWKWLEGAMHFPGQPYPPGSPVTTDVGPIQKFRWSDYRVRGGRTYLYRVHARYGRHDDETPKLVTGPEVEVTTASLDASGVHNVLFNRAAGASQAFSRDYPDAVRLIEARRKEGTLDELTVDELDAADKGCKEWLDRGVLKQIVSLIDQAKDSSWALDIGIYEYEWHEIVAAVDNAAGRGVEIRLIYHAKEGDKQTGENEENLQGLITSGQAKPRKTNKIFHNKFIVLSKVKRKASGITRKPLTVLCGSTNFTENGLFRQANVVHVVRTEKGAALNPVADRYLAYFDILWNEGGDAALEVGKTKKWINDNNPMQPEEALFTGFSPRTGGGDLEEFAGIINSATQDVLFCTVFKLPPIIVDALMGQPHDPILRLGVQDKNSNKIAGFHKDRTAQFSTTALLTTGIEGWMLREVRTGGEGSLLIHTKAVVVDFTTDSPSIISGSHNLSGSASNGNDENYFIIRGNTDLADCYGVEMMRIYDHYRARFVAEKIAAGDFKADGLLKTTNAWTNRYFREGSLHQRDRLRFAGD